MSQHVVSVRTYASVFAALIVLLILTVAAANIEHGALSLTVGLSIAVAKAVLIVLFFMHARYSPGMIRLAACAGFFWLAILLALSVGDNLTRAMPPATTSQLRDAADGPVDGPPDRPAKGS